MSNVTNCYVRGLVYFGPQTEFHEFTRLSYFPVGGVGWVTKEVEKVRSLYSFSSTVALLVQTITH